MPLLNKPKHLKPGQLPHCDELFLRFFDPWYVPAARKARGYAGAQPDLGMVEPGTSVTDLGGLAPEGQALIARQVQAMFDAARADWPSYLEVVEPVSLVWIDAFDRHFDRERVAGLIAGSEASDFTNDYMVTCCELGAVLGQVPIDAEPPFEWLYSWPYWESALLHPPSGTVVNVFDWAIKKLSDYGVDDGLAAKVQRCIEQARRGWN